MRCLILTAFLCACGQIPKEQSCTFPLMYQTRIDSYDIDRILFSGSSEACPLTQWTGVFHIRIEVSIPEPSAGSVDYLYAGKDRLVYLSLRLARGSTATDLRFKDNPWQLPWLDTPSFKLLTTIPHGTTTIPTEVILTVSAGDE